MGRYRFLPRCRCIAGHAYHPTKPTRTHRASKLAISGRVFDPATRETRFSIAPVLDPFFDGLLRTQHMRGSPPTNLNYT